MVFTRKASARISVETFDVPCYSRIFGDKSLLKQDTPNDFKRTQHAEDISNEFKLMQHSEDGSHFSCVAPGYAYVGDTASTVQHNLDVRKRIQHCTENCKRSFLCDVPGNPPKPILSQQSLGKAWRWLSAGMPTMGIGPQTKQVSLSNSGIPAASVDSWECELYSGSPQKKFHAWQDESAFIQIESPQEAKIRRSARYEEHWRGCKYRRSVEHTEITVDPWRVMFSKPSISDRFTCGRSLVGTIEGLQKGNINVEDIPKIMVVEQGGRFITLDHRRLYCFRSALPKGTSIQVLLLKTSWLAHRYIPPGAKVYSAVRVEKDYLKQAVRDCVWY